MNNFKYEKPEVSIGFLLWKVSNSWQRQIKKALKPFNLTHSQFVILTNIYWLTTQKIEITQIKLSQVTQIDPMTTSTIIKNLIQRNLITRREHSTDTRAKLIDITNKGMTLIIPAIKIVEDFDISFFKILETQSENFNCNLTKLLEDKNNI